VNYYKLLNIERGADANQIKRAYFSAVKLHSPDSDPEGFKAIRVAYETLLDPKSRAEYDAFFTVSGDLQNDLLAARELILENKYKQAMEFLTDLNGKNPDSTDVKRILAMVLWYLKKSGTADKMCGELLEKDPSDYETLLLRAKIAASMRRIDKANEYFTNAVNIDPLNQDVWVAYLRFGLNYAHSKVPNIFYRAMEQDINMFRDEYVLYLVGAQSINLFNSEKQLQYLDKFAEFYINDEDPDEEIYTDVMNLMPRIMAKDGLIPFVEKILPTLEKSKHRNDDDEESFKYMRAIIVMHKLRSDKRIHDVLVDLTGCILEDDEEDKDDRLQMEVYIVFHISELRPSIKILKNEYPEYFKLNHAFYLDVLNERKEEFLTDKYTGIYKKIRPKNTVFSGEEFFDDDDDEKPYIRESPKVGRNDPCPCGSGKKYKKCCGA
jgi:preprotein translocase subunit SecA